MTDYLQKIQYLYPGIQGVMYWHTQSDGTPWNNPYDGIVWENTDIEKPSQAMLDELNDEIVTKELARRHELSKKGQFVQSTPLDSMEAKIAKFETQMVNLQNLLNDQFTQTSNIVKISKIQVHDLQNALIAINGFVMQIPVIEKSLQDIKQMLQK